MKIISNGHKYSNRALEVAVAELTNKPETVEIVSDKITGTRLIVDGGKHPSRFNIEDDYDYYRRYYGDDS